MKCLSRVRNNVAIVSYELVTIVTINDGLTHSTTLRTGIDNSDAGLNTNVMSDHQAFPQWEGESEQSV